MAEEQYVDVLGADKLEQQIVQDKEEAQHPEKSASAWCGSDSGAAPNRRA